MNTKKGHTNNPHGRPKGSKNRRTNEWEALGESIMTTHADRLNEVLSSLDDEEFVRSYAMILQYFKPKLASQTIDGNLDTEVVITIKEPPL